VSITDVVSDSVLSDYLKEIEGQSRASQNLVKVDPISVTLNTQLPLMLSLLLISKDKSFVNKRYCLNEKCSAKFVT
jgi:hypothetical protein